MKKFILFLVGCFVVFSCSGGAARNANDRIEATIRLNTHVDVRSSLRFKSIKYFLAEDVKAGDIEFHHKLRDVEFCKEQLETAKQKHDYSFSIQYRTEDLKRAEGYLNDHLNLVYGPRVFNYEDDLSTDLKTIESSAPLAGYWAIATYSAKNKYGQTMSDVECFFIHKTHCKATYKNGKVEEYDSYQVLNKVNILDYHEAEKKVYQNQIITVK